MHKTFSKRAGVTMVITLGAIAGLVVIVASVAATVNITQRARVNREATVRARWMAMAGIQYGLSSLQAQSTTATTQQDNWATTGCASFATPGDTRYTVNDGTFRIQIVDSASLIDINTAPQAQLQNLPLTPEQVDSLLDWRTPGETPRPDGAKDSFYNSLTVPYNAKLTRLDSIDELLQVQYFTRDVIYDTPTTVTNTQLTVGTNGTQPTLASLITVDSSSPQTTAGKVNVSTRTGNAQTVVQTLQRAGLPVNIATTVAQRRPYTSYTALLRIPGVTTAIATTLLNTCTVSAGTTAEGKINLNTATQPVLNSIPGIQPDISQAIITRQTTPLTKLGDIMTIPGISVTTAGALADATTVASTTFLIRVIGSVGTTTVALEATVTIANGNAVVKKVVEEPFPNMDARWNWADVATDTILVDPTQIVQQ